DEDAAPSAEASASVRGRSSPSQRTIVLLRTSACTIADSRNPRMRAQMISQVIDPAMDKACVTAGKATSLRIVPFGGLLQPYTPLGYSMQRDLSPIQSCRD